MRTRGCSSALFDAYQKDIVQFLAGHLLKRPPRGVVARMVRVLLQCGAPGLSRTTQGQVMKLLKAGSARRLPPQVVSTTLLLLQPESPRRRRTQRRFTGTSSRREVLRSCARPSESRSRRPTRCSSGIAQEVETRTRKARPEAEGRARPVGVRRVDDPPSPRVEDRRRLQVARSAQLDIAQFSVTPGQRGLLRERRAQSPLGRGSTGAGRRPRSS